MKPAFIILFIFISALSYGQTNIGFEKGDVSGWICKSGYYGSANDSCPSSVACSRLPTVFTDTGQLNPGGINAPLAGGGDRHVIVTGSGHDPNSSGIVPFVAPGGGNYSFRLGNSNTGNVNGNKAQAEGMRLNFPVTGKNASFTYRYAFFVSNLGHQYLEQPGFEVRVLDQNENIIPCGRYFVVAGNYPGCVNAAGFTSGVNGYVFKNWTDVGLDLTPYIGQNISIEFRTTDCITGSGCCQGSCQNNICTYCSGGKCCTYAMGMSPCNPLPPGICVYGAGSHSAYAYIDAYTSAMARETSFLCGASAAQLCAPAGYVSYSWPAGQAGLSGSPAMQCVTVSNPVPGKTYTVNMVSATGCPTKTTVTLQASGIKVNSAVICQGDTVLLKAVGGSSWSWNTGETTSSVQVSPAATSTYVVASGSGTCSATATATVTVGSSIVPVISGFPSVCVGSSATLSASGGNHYSWSTGSTGDTIIVASSSFSSYWVSSQSAGCSGADTFNVSVLPLPTASVTAGGPTSFCYGGSVNLTANSGGSSYKWSNGSITQSIAVCTSGYYDVTVTGANGCSAISAPVYITVLPLPTATISASGPLTFCSGDSVILTVGTGASYLWSTGATTQSLTTGATGNYYVTVTSVNGCSRVSLDVNVMAVPRPVAGFSFTSTPPNISFSNISSGAAGYLWDFGDGSYSSFANPVHAFPVNGTYTVCLVATANPNCKDTVCQVVNINTSVDEYQDIRSVTLFPNPSKYETTLEIVLNEKSEVVIVIQDMTGGEVYQSRHRLNSGKSRIVMDMAHISNGIYFVKLVAGNSIRNIKAVVVK